MRALITGINGFVGGHLAEALLHAGGWDIWGASREQTLALAQFREQIQFVSLDLCDAAPVNQTLKQIQPDVIFHLAGQAFVPESFRDPAATLHNNITAQLHILLALIEQHINSRVLVVGSNEEYGIVRPEDVPVDEDTPLRPVSPYGVSKVAQDMLALQYHLSHKLDVVRVRPFNHIGPRQDSRFVASSFARQIAEIEHALQPAVVKVGNLSAERDFTDVRDMVRAYILAVEKGESGQVYNLGAGTAVSIQTLLDLLLAASHTAVEVQIDPERVRPSDVPRVVCDTRRFHMRTGWEPQIPLQQTLHDILEDWRIRVRQEIAPPR